MFKSMKSYLKKPMKAMRDPETKALLFFVILTLAIGTTVFTYVENWDVVDSFYFSVITLTTTGYGDIAPVTTFGKLFTVVYLLMGLGIMFAFLKKIADSAMEGRSK